MKAIVRDDIISLKSFVAAEFKYKRYLEILKKSGNYCFLDQFKKIVPGAVAIINGMSENNLITTENYNKSYKYIYLTDTAMKYLCLKDSDEDFSDVQKNKISVQKVNKFPTEKQLFSSTCKFHLLVNNDTMIDKESILKAIEDRIYLQELGYTKDKFINYTNEQMKIINDKKSELTTEIKYAKELVNVISAINKDVFNFEAEDQEIRKLKGEKVSLESEINKRKNERKLIKSSTVELEAQLSQVERRIKELSPIFELKRNTLTKHNNFIKEKNFSIKESNTVLKNEESEITKIIKKEQDVVIPKVEKTQRTFEKLYDISKIIARINNNTLEFIIFDFGKFKTAAQYLKILNEIQDLKLNYDNIKIIIYSYTDHRAENLTKEFLSYDKRRATALKSLQTYNARLEEFEDYDEGYRPTFFIKANETFDSIPKFELEVRRDFYYMSAYREFITRGEKPLKRNEKKIIKDIMEKLKND